MESMEAKLPQNPPRKTHKLVLCAQICLRIVAISTAFAATWTIVNAKETVVVFGLQFDARYTYSSAFKFFAFANAIACGFTSLSLMFVLLIFRHGRFTPSNFFFLFLHDLFMMSLILSGVAAGTAIGFVGRYGNSHAGWSEICDRLKKYCDKVTASMVLSYLSVICLVVLTVISAENPRLNTHHLFLFAQICWRMIAITTAFAATWTTVTSKETGSYSSAFKFLAFANAFTCGFALLFLSFVFFFGRHGLNPTNHLLFLHDMFLMSLMLSGVAAGTAFGYLGRRGYSHTGWSQTCNPSKVTTSMCPILLTMLCPK